MAAASHTYAGLIEQRRRVRALRREAAAGKRLVASELAPVFKRYGIRGAYLFGSVTRGACSPGSDIDLYVEPVPPERFWSLLHDLEERAGQAIDLYCQRDDADFISKIKQRGERIYEG